MKTILCRVGPRTISPRTRRGLSRLGYRLVDADGGGRRDPEAPVLQLVSDGRLGELPPPDADPTPLVILASGRREPDFEPRAAGLLFAPVGLTELYAAFQDALERWPRRNPRIASQLPARGIWDTEARVGQITSLSERGCRFEAPEPLPGDDPIELQFALTGQGLVRTSTRCVHQDEAGIGLVFTEPSGRVRKRVSSFVSSALTR